MNHSTVKRPVEDSDSPRISQRVYSMYERMTPDEIDLHGELLAMDMRQYARDQSRRMERECNEDLWKRIEQHLYEEALFPKRNPRK